LHFSQRGPVYAGSHSVTSPSGSMTATEEVGSCSSIESSVEFGSSRMAFGFVEAL
jgi:hypothetical protein